MTSAHPSSTGSRPDARIVVPPDLRDHADRVRWNCRYRTSGPDFAPHQLVSAAQTAGLPDGPVLELACGRSGSALALAAAGRMVTAVDVSDLALSQLAAEAQRRGLAGRMRFVMADVPSYDPGDEQFALVMATYFWNVAAFHTGCRAVRPDGLLGWEALADQPDTDGLLRPWHVPHGQLGALLPSGFEVLIEEAHTGERHNSTMVLARRTRSPET